MTIKIGVVMDAIESIKIQKDSTFAMLLAAQARGWEIFYMQQHDIYSIDGEIFATITPLQVEDDTEQWFAKGQATAKPLTCLDIILMRKDPPFDMQYIYTTYLLELAEQAGVLVANKPQSLRDANEKCFTAQFPQCCPATLITRSTEQLKLFLQQHQDTVFKPLDGMGGQSIFRVRAGEPNLNVIIELLTARNRSYIMAQKYIPAIRESGDKRILLINGKPIPYALARIPQGDDIRGNLAAGAKGVVVPLNERDQWICEEVGPTLQARGIYFAGIDVIGDYLSEINITSPTCIREINQVYEGHIADELLDCLEAKRYLLNA